MKTLLNKFSYTVIFIIFIVNLCSCDLLDELIGPHKIEEQNLEVYSTRNSTSYLYMDKVEVAHTRNNGEYTDSLILRIGEDITSTDGNYVILSGKFDSVGWNNNVLYIYSDNNYYVFDIENYNVPEKNIDKDKGQSPDYELLKYTKDEFVKKFPNYKDFYWNEFYS